MSDEATPATGAPSKSRMRSPAYPFFGLGEAINRAQLVWDALRKNDGHLDSVIHAMGYNGANGASLRAVGAMNHYGMFEESGAKGNRRIRLSELAQDILHLPADDGRRAAALRTSALSPTIHQVLWERYQQNPPKDDVIKGFLVRERNYSPEAASDVIRNYRETFLIAKLGDVTDSKLSGTEEDLAQHVSSVQGPQQVDAGKSPGYSIAAVQSVSPAVLIPQSTPALQELPVLVDHGQVARIPFPMSEDAFDLLIGTLQLWKKKLVSTQATAASPTAALPKLIEEGGSQG